MLPAFTILLVCQALGEAIVRLAGLPVPGPVLGMLLLFAWLARKGEVPEPLARTSAGLLEHLSLLFVPAGTGVVLYLDLIASEWTAIVAALVVSTLATILVTAFVMSRLGSR
ncbi:MAG: CidA/LrgA family protein [Rhodospirillales bacterium]|nr:CidA/LrgA family protein [Rhodospirillales bacterium]